MFLQATLRPLGEPHPEPFGIRVRNLSAGGLMAEAEATVAVGDPISVALRNIGAVDGKVAWARGGRFGVTFDAPIDPKLARKPVKAEVVQPIISKSGFRRITHPLG